MSKYIVVFENDTFSIRNQDFFKTFDPCQLKNHGTRYYKIDELSDEELQKYITSNKDVIRSVSKPSKNLIDFHNMMWII